MPPRTTRGSERFVQLIPLDTVTFSAFTAFSAAAAATLAGVSLSYPCRLARFGEYLRQAQALYQCSSAVCVAAIFKVQGDMCMLQKQV